MKKIFLMMLMIVLLVGTVSAFTIDNWVSYSQGDMKVTITNAFGLGATLGTVELKSHASVNQILEVQYGGEFVTMYYDFTGWDINENGLGDVIFVNMNTGKEVIKDYTFVEWKEVEVNNTIDICDYNKETYTNCRYENNGTKWEYQWVELVDRDIKNTRIGIKTYVGAGDYIDGVWTIEGKEIKKHAEWTADLNTGLLRWYDLEDLTENLTSDDLTNYNSVTFGTGKIGNGAEGGSTNTDKTLNVSSNWDINGNTTSFSVWIKPEGVPTGDDGVMGQCNEDTDTCYSLAYTNYAGNSVAWHRIKPGVADTQIRFAQDLGTGTWFHIVGTYDGTNLYLFIDGVWKETLAASGSGSVAQTNRAGFLKEIFGGTAFFNGTVDLAGVWGINLTQSQITQLNNGGDGMTYKADFRDLPNVALSTPANDSSITLSSQSFTATIFDNDSIKNASFILNDEYNATNVTAGVNNSLYTFNVVGLAEGNHTWTMEACDSDEGCFNATQRTFIVDTVIPATSISDPNTTINYHEANTNITFSWTANDTRLDACVFQYGGSNTTVACVDNTTTFNVTNNINRDLIFYVNDTFGNRNDTNVTWEYRVFEYNSTFTSSVTEGSTETFVGNVSIGASDSLVSAILTYNGTDKGVSSDSTTAGEYDYINLSSTFEVINVFVNGSTTDFFWQLILDSGLQINTSTRTQTIMNFEIDNCTTNTQILYNFTIVDEKTQVKLIEAGSNTTGELNLQVFPIGSTTALANFSQLFNQTNSFAVCLNTSLSSGESYNLNAQVQYNADGYDSEFYHIQNNTLTSADFNINITLYDLDEDSSEEFKINFKDASFLPVEDALIQVQRKYVSEGLFKTVEIPKTDSNGDTVVHLELEDVLYNFIIVKDGVILATFNDFLVNCNTLLSECELNLNIVSSHVDIDDFTSLDDFTFTLDYNETSRLISSVFTVPSSSISTVSLNATLLDTLGTTEVCSEQLTSSGGTLSCTVPANFGNGSVMIRLYKDEVKQGDGVIGLWQSPADIFGANQVFLLLFLYLTLIGVGISDSPIITVFSLMLGVILAIGLNLVRIGGSGGGFIGEGATILWIIIAFAIVINKGGGRI